MSNKKTPEGVFKSGATSHSADEKAVKEHMV